MRLFIFVDYLGDAVLRWRCAGNRRTEKQIQAFDENY